MKHRRSFGVVALVAAIAVLDGGQVLYAAEGVSEGAPAILGEAHPRPSQGYLGVDMRDVTEDQMTVLKLKGTWGAEITNLDHDGPACKAGMQLHDVVLQMNGQVIENEEQLRRLLRDLPVGRSVRFVVSRDGQTRTMTMTMADRKTVEQLAWEQHY